jgi:putative transcriptional regulator
MSMGAEIGEATSLSALRQVGAANAAVRLLAKAATEMRAGSDFAAQAADPIGGELLARQTPAPLGEHALERTLALIDSADAADRWAVQQVRTGRPHADELLGLPAPVRDAGLKALRRQGWSFGGFGIKRLPLVAGGGAIAELVRVEPGHGAAEHDHTADELTLVLTGAYSDGHARFEPGEISRAAPGLLHAPRAEPGALCYLMLISFGPARFTGQIGLLQRLMGFPWQPKVDEGD